MARTIELAGHQVRIGSGAQSSDGKGSNLEFETHSLGELPVDTWGRVRKAGRQLSWGKRTATWLDSSIPKADAVIVYGGSTPYMRTLIPWCRQNRVPIIVDAVEWYRGADLPGGVLGPFSLSNSLAMRRYYPMARNVIAISRFLEGYFESRGCQVVRIPPTRDVTLTSTIVPPNGDMLRLAYAGAPGRKDLLDRVLESILAVNAAGAHPRVQFDIAGPSATDVLRSPAMAVCGSQLPNWLRVHGRLAAPQVRSIIQSADFTPLLRPVERYSKAGFPTKVTESLALGTPVICNLTSDLSDYLVDGREMILSADSSVAAFTAAVERSLSLSPDERSAMRTHARATAEKSFDSRNYVQPMKEFLQSLRTL